MRQQQGLSQDELAFRSHLHRTYLSDLERGVSSPSLDAIEGLAQALGVQPHQLVQAAEERRASAST